MAEKMSMVFDVAHRYDEKYLHSFIERAEKRKTLRKFVDEIITEGLNSTSLKEKIEMGNRILYASNHKSHLDYLLLGYVIYKSGLPMPRFAAGQNLLIWPINALIDFRKMGAFSIDRKNNEFSYRRNLYQYIQKLESEGEHILFFPEGGRSYNGKYMEPKTGLVRAVLDEVKKEKIKVDVVPIHIDYDVVMEREIFSLLEKAKEIRFVEKGFYYALDFYAVLKRYFSTEKGKVYIKFGDPINIRNLGECKKKVAGEIMHLIKLLGEKRVSADAVKLLSD